MTRNLFTTSILALAFVGTGSSMVAASAAETGDHYTKAQMKELARKAHAPEQYKLLAHYYGERQKNYLELAAEEKTEWERRGHNVSGILAKYPRPVDSARNLYEFYMAKASESGTLEAKYSDLAAPETAVNAQ